VRWNDFIREKSAVRLGLVFFDVLFNGGSCGWRKIGDCLAKVGHGIEILVSKRST